MATLAVHMNAATLPQEELQERGWAALESALGREGAARFFRDYKVRDYTAERHLWLDGSTVAEVCTRIRAGRAGDEASSEA